MYAKLTSDNQIGQYPYTVGDLRRDNPNTSFPKQISQETLTSYGLVTVQGSPQPSYNTLTHRLKESVPVLEDGVWKQVWTTEPYLDADVRVRKQRDRLLAQSDWTQVSDAPVDQTAWATYRQALRDVPAQENFPHSILWPNEPEL